MAFKTELTALADIIDAVPAADRIHRLSLYASANAIVELIGANSPEPKYNHANGRLASYMEDLAKATLPQEVHDQDKHLEEARMDLGVAQGDFKFN